MKGQRTRLPAPAPRPAAARAAPTPAPPQPDTAWRSILDLQQTVGNRATTSVLQRVTAQNTWAQRIEPRLALGAKKRTMALFTRDVDDVEVKVAKTGANAYISSVGGAAGVPIPNVNAFLAAHTWTQEISTMGADREAIDFSDDQTLHSNADLSKPTVNLDVQDVEGDKHNLLHYTMTPYKTAGSKKEASQAREQGHHLTMENTHLLFLLTLQQDKTLKFLDKTTLDKPGVNEYINGNGVAGIDNINFFPQQQASRPLSNEAIPMNKLETMADAGNEAVDDSLSLNDYMRFVARVAEGLTDVSPVYAAKMLHSLQVMQRLTGFDPAQMFLKVGKGDQRQVLRTLVTVAVKGMAPGLVLPPKTLATFRRYIEAKPYLPKKEPVDDKTEWIIEAGLGTENVRYNDLEPVYVEQHYPGAIDALHTYLG